MDRPELTGIAPVTMQVFFDNNGRRWRRFIVTMAVLLCVTTVLLTWVIPKAIDPANPAPANQSSDYPRQITDQINQSGMPVIGQEKGMLTRVAKIRHDAGDTYLDDPFSNKTFRLASKDDIQRIGESQYVLDRFGVPADRQLILTFDDGPHPQMTPQVLDLLSRNGVPATFFVLGEHTVQTPAIIQRMVSEGHMVGNHTMNHVPRLENYSDFWGRQELIATDRLIRASANYSTPLWRLPEGNPDNKPYGGLLGQQLGMLQVDFDYDTNDWRYTEDQPIPMPPLDGKGHVVLLHDGLGERPNTLQLVQQIIDEAKSQGYSFGTMAQIIPQEYLPMANVQPDLADKVSYWSLWMADVLPSRVLTMLETYGVASLTFLSAGYLILAWFNYFRYRRKKWFNSGPPLPVCAVLPAYNEGLVVRKSLASLLASDYPDLEIIAVNDGSTDDTGDILEDFAAGHPSIRVVHQANQGKAGALNTGIRLTNRPIIFTMDGDTLVAPNAISKLVRHFKDRSVGVVGGHVKVGNRGSLMTWQEFKAYKASHSGPAAIMQARARAIIVLLTWWQSLEYLVGICVTRMGEGALGAITIAPGACAAWRKAAILKAGGFSDRTRAEDAALTMAIQRLRYKVIQENEAIALTEVPERFKPLCVQRLRWVFGNVQAMYEYRGMLLNPRYGVVGFSMAYSLMSMVLSLLVLPIIVVMSIYSVTYGDWQSIALFAGLVAGIHLAQTVTALLMLGETPLHLLVVPIYRLIYEPLRAYLLYASVLQILKGNGRAFGWNKLDRTASVQASPLSRV